MSKWTVERIKAFYSQLNERYGLNVNPNIIVQEKYKYPMCRRDFNNLVFVPEFFNHEHLSEDTRRMLLLCFYSCFHLDKNKDGYLDINPGFLAKGMCDDLGYKYVSDSELQANERRVRRMLYDDVENGCYFSIGHQLRESAFSSYEVVDISVTPAEVLVKVKPIGCHLGEPEKTFTEEELFERCCNFFDFENYKIDMRRNLYIISGPSGAGKNEVFNQLKKQCPEINKTVSVTTRKPRSNEKEGVDYYFVSKEEFYDYQMDSSLVENELFDCNYYGTFFSEVERHPTDKPLFLIVDVRGRRNVLTHYPMAKTIFIEPPSIEELEKRIRSRGENTEHEIEHRLTVAVDEIKQKTQFDYVLINGNAQDCARQLNNIISKKLR